MSLRRTGIVLALACGTVLVPATAAAAVEPERTGWWNRVSAGGLVAPAPTTQEGDLRIASGGDAPAAYSAVLYRTADATAATLDLKVRSGSTLGTPEVVACPTETTEWEAGENQPIDEAPAYDCERSSAFGSLSEDGTTLSFLLDESSQLEPGVWSLALVPQPGSTTGLFAIDVEKPAPEAFVVTATSTPEPALPSDSGSTTFDSGDGFEGSSGEPFTGSFEAPPSFDSFDTGSAEMPPLLAEGAEAPLPEAASQEPAVAEQTPGAPIIYARPAGVVEDLGTGRRLLGLLVLAGGSAAVGYAAGQQRPGPRLLGGRARLGTPVPVPAGGAPSPQERPRGIGRFAKARDAAPRRLR